MKNNTETPKNNHAEELETEFSIQIKLHKTMTNTGLIQAKELLNNIINQVTLKDFPYFLSELGMEHHNSRRQFSSNSMHRIKNICHRSSEYNRQHHVLPFTMTSGHPLSKLPVISPMNHPRRSPFMFIPPSSYALPSPRTHNTFFPPDSSPYSTDSMIDESFNLSLSPLTIVHCFEDQDCSVVSKRDSVVGSEKIPFYHYPHDSDPSVVYEQESIVKYKSIEELDPEQLNEYNKQEASKNMGNKSLLGLCIHTLETVANYIDRLNDSNIVAEKSSNFFQNTITESNNSNGFFIPYSKSIDKDNFSKKKNKIKHNLETEFEINEKCKQKDHFNYNEINNSDTGNKANVEVINMSTGPTFKPSLIAAYEAEKNTSGTSNEFPFPQRTFENVYPPKIMTTSTPLIIPKRKIPLSKYSRVQMFGSEYARHLSSLSPLSPPIFISRKNKYTNGLLNNHKYRMRSKKSCSNPTVYSSQHTHSTNTPLCLEDASPEVLTGAITDILITHGTEVPPKGYYRISQTSSSKNIHEYKNKNISTRGTTFLSSMVRGRKTMGVYINVKKEANWHRAVQRPCVTALVVIFPDRKEFVPPGFSVVRRQVYTSTPANLSLNNTNDTAVEESMTYTIIPANLNAGTQGERVFLCYRRSREGNPITGILPLIPSLQEAIPEGYTVLERTPRNFVADINSMAGPAIFLAIRQRLANLECLRPLPLLFSFYSNYNKSYRKIKGQNITQRKYRKRQNLKAYYCTGGTVVSAHVGRLHVMDRSTHPLISPSSVSNRLHLIEASRCKKGQTTTITNESLCNTKSTPVNQSLSFVDTFSFDIEAPFDTIKMSGRYPIKLTSDYFSEEKSLTGDTAKLYLNDPETNTVAKSLFSTSTESVFSSPLSDAEESVTGFDNSPRRGGVFVSYEDAVLQASFEAMEFIPPIMDASQSSAQTLSTFTTTESLDHTLLQIRIAVITPIVTACYTQHGGSCLIAVEGLTQLLQRTEFFRPDVAIDLNDAEVAIRLTLLDLAIQVVCDVGNSSSKETNFLSCLEFISCAVEYSKGKLNTRTIGYILRFYLFVFYFGASIPTTTWPQKQQSSLTNIMQSNHNIQTLPVHYNDTIVLLDEEELETLKQRGDRPGVCLSGGAPQVAALALKTLITVFLGRLIELDPIRTHVLNDNNEDTPNSDDPNKDSVTTLMNTIIDSLIDNAIHCVDSANYTQLALHQIHRSGGSELFWHDMVTSCGAGLFVTQGLTATTDLKDFHILSFSILACLVKVTSGKLRKVAGTFEFVPRDVSSKLLSLELLEHFLQCWHPISDEIVSNRRNNIINTKSNSATMVYAIRRLVVPCLLSNTESGLNSIRVFIRMMKVMTMLWCTTQYRQNMKIELGVMIEHFMLKFLQLGPQVSSLKSLKPNKSISNSDHIPLSLFQQQLCVLREIKVWFSCEPRNILELFLNFDYVDVTSSQNHFRLLPSTHWKITQKLFGAICILAEKCAEVISDSIKMTRIDKASTHTDSPTVLSQSTEVACKELTIATERAKRIQETCFEVLSEIVRSMMLCAVATSGVNYNSLKSLREKKKIAISYARKKKNVIKPKKLFPGETKSADGANEKIVDNDDNESSTSSNSSMGNLTVKSISTIGNIVGGLKKKINGFNAVDTFNESDSSIIMQSSTFEPALSPMKGKQKSSGSGGILEYWQTSIAPERKKHMISSIKSDRSTTNINKDRQPIRNGLLSKVPRPPRASLSTRSLSPHKLCKPHTVPLNSPISSRSKSPIRMVDDPVTISIGVSSVVSINNDSIECVSRTADPKMEETMRIAFEIVETKSLKKALDYLMACNFLTSSPRDISSFLRLHQGKLGPAAVGEYLGEGGRNRKDQEHFNLVRFNYVRAISFVGMNIEEGLRYFLTNCGFRLPGEAQRIDRIMTTFSQCYWEDNAGDYVRCPFHNPDTIFLLSFAIIMLNTDLHKTSSFITSSNLKGKQRKRKKMTKLEFQNNLIGIDHSETFSREFLSDIYDSIASYPIVIYHPMRNMNDFSDKNDDNTNTFSDMITFLLNSVKSSQELLRGLSVHEHPYLTIRPHHMKRRNKTKSLTYNLVRMMFSSTWHHFHGVINTVIDSAHLEPKGMIHCLALLKYSLCLTICLDLTIERNAFITQLVRIKLYRENRGLVGKDNNEYDNLTMSSMLSRSIQTTDRIRDHLEFKNDAWFKQLEQAVDSHSEAAKVTALDAVDDMFHKVQGSMKVDSKLKKEMYKIIARIRNGQVLLNDPTRHFVKEGILAKKCNRTGRITKYTFFLFSDILVYAHKSTHGNYIMHEELPLHLLKIDDPWTVMNISNGHSLKQKRSFRIIHPKKSFFVIALNPKLKDEWITIITSAVALEVKRRAHIDDSKEKCL